MGRRSLFYEKRCKLKVHIPPVYTTSIYYGVINQLNKILFAFNETLNGIPILYKEMNIDQTVSKILNDNPYIHIAVSLTFIIFSPKSGVKAAGIVNRVTPGHIGLVTFGLLNTTIPFRNLSEGHTWDKDKNVWIDNKTERETGLGSKVAFNIDTAHFGKYLVTSTGTLCKHEEGRNPLL